MCRGFAGLNFLGNENYPPILQEVGRAVPHGHMQMTMGGGLFVRLKEQVDDRGIPCWTLTRTSHLIVDDTTGEIVGVEATKRGKELNIKARRGVVLAAGGYAHNKEEFVKHHLLNYWDDVGHLPGTNVGDGIKMALEVGADLFDCDGASHLYPYGFAFNMSAAGPLAIPFNCFYVNRHGKRFCNEEWHHSAHALHWAMTGSGKEPPMG